MRSLFKSMYAYSAYLKNHYQTLGILSTASDEEIKAAYYKLAKANHPDITPENSNKFKEIGEAYNVLKDPLKRREFDLTINPPKPNADHMNINEYYTKGHQQFKQGAKYEYPHYGDTSYFQRKFSKQFSRNRNFTKDQLRSSFPMGSQIPYNSSHLLFLAVIGFFGSIVVVEIMIGFYKFAGMQRETIYHEYVPYDLQDEEDDDY